MFIVVTAKAKIDGSLRLAHDQKKKNTYGSPKVK